MRRTEPDKDGLIVENVTENKGRRVGCTIYGEGFTVAFIPWYRNKVKKVAVSPLKSVPKLLFKRMQKRAYGILMERRK